jgi:VWFA-related protein
MRSTASLLMIALAVLGQTPAPDDEVRVSSRPYLPPSVVMHVESNLVQVGVVVRDAKGRAISGFKREDFRVLDQGKDRDISSFTVDVLSERAAPAPPPPTAAPTVAATPSAAPTPLPVKRPRFIALFFDDVGTPAGDVMRTKVAGKRFVQDGLSSSDQVAVFTSSGGCLTEYTADKARILAAIDKINSHPRFSESGLSSCPRITPYDAYLISNYMGEHIIQLKIQELRQCGPAPPPPAGGCRGCPSAQQLDPARGQIMAQAEMTWGQVKVVSQNTLEGIRGTVNDLAHRRGTRMLLLVSSGFLAGTLFEDRDRVIDDALRADVVINSLDAKGLFVEAPGHPWGENPPPINLLQANIFSWDTMAQVAAKDAPSEVLSDLAAATGGLFFHHNNDYSFGFRELGSVPDVTYLLGFRPGDGDGKYHNLKVHLASNSGHSGYVIEARPGYFAAAKATAPGSAPAATPRGRFDAEVNGAASSADFPVKVSVDLGAKLPNGATRMDVQFHVDAAALPFPQKDDRRTQRFTLVAALFDSSGKMITAKEGTMELALKDAQFQRFIHDGVNLSLSLGAASGAYRLRTVVQEGVDNKMAAAASEVQVP